MAYVFINGIEEITDPITEDDSIAQALHWIGFRNDVQRTSLIADAFESYDDIKMLTEKDITTMASDYSSRTVADGRIIFGTRRTKALKAYILWIRDFYRVSGTPTIVGKSEVTFKAALSIAVDREDVRKTMRSQTPIQAPLASPGPLESEKQWKHWEEKFYNFTRLHIGSNGVPLSYVLRENDAPDVTGTYTDFVSKTIKCAPLTGEHYVADTATVFHMIVSFTTGLPSGDWIKNTIRYADGRRSMKALKDHFAGEGNTTRTLAEAERLRETLHYKNERSMTFETFLTQCQKMFNIYEKYGEPMSDAAKVRFLFSKVQHTGLEGPIDALKAQQSGGVVITYSRAANHLSTSLSELPDYISRGRRGLAVVHTKGSSAIYNADGSIITGHIPTWSSLSKGDRDIVKNERKKQGIKGPKGGGPSKSNTSADTNRMKQLAAQNKKYKRAIKALKSSSSDDTVPTAVTAGSSDESDIDAGDQFGGKNSKKKSKKK